MRTKHELIEHLIASLNRVSYRNREELDAFKTEAETMIKILEGDTSEYRYQLRQARFAPWSFEASEEDYQKNWEQGKETVLKILKNLEADEKLNFQDVPVPQKVEPIETPNPVEVPQTPEPPVSMLSTPEAPTQELPAAAPESPTIQEAPISTPPEPHNEPPKKVPLPKPPHVSNRILLIHGSENEMKEKVLAVLNKWGWTAVLSFDRENFHKPLAQKMTEFSDAALVIVLLSFDGYFYGKDQKVKDAKFVSQPNVVFELGFMLGKFGRDRVFVLYEEKKNYELPTAFFNAYYIPYDENRIWQEELLKALKDHGITVDPTERKPHP